MKLPKKIYLTRHLKSLGNFDRTQYNKIPDHQIPILSAFSTQKLLDKDFWIQSRDDDEIALKTSGIIPVLQDRYQNKTLDLKTSYYARAHQTASLISELICAGTNNTLKINNTTNFSDRLLHEIRCKLNLTETTEEYLDNLEKEQKEYGEYYYTWPGGESPVDHSQRVITWWNDFRLNHSLLTETPNDLLIVSHQGTIAHLLNTLVSNNPCVRNPYNYFTEKDFPNGSTVELQLIEGTCFYTHLKSYNPHKYYTERAD